jgi:DNA primase
VNIRRIAWGKGLKDSRYRALNTKGHGECRLFPEGEVVKADRMVLVGGEWDALIGRQCGMPTVSWTGGEGSWNHEYDWIFRDKGVFILYDNDDAGKRGAEEAMKKARRAGACHVENLMPLMKAKDLNDWYLKDPQAVFFLASDVKAQVVVRENTGICPYCGQTLPEEKG